MVRKEHPLPAGMRDLLPEEARERRDLAQRALARLELFGYELVLLPAFEFADVLERGLGVLDASEVLRFVEPESGEVAAFRPDMTPQIARMIATRLGSRPPPFRLAYEGTVLRRLSARGLARGDRFHSWVSSSSASRVSRATSRCWRSRRQRSRRWVSETS